MSIPGVDVSRKETFLIGMSHIDAVGRALELAPDDRLRVESLRRDHRLKRLAKSMRIDSAFLQQFKGNKTVTLLGGNEHLIIGLVEHPERFDFLTPHGHAGSVLPDRRLIPYNLIRNYLFNRVEVSTLNHLQQICDEIGPPVADICPPPPIGDVPKIRVLPKRMRAQIHLGITPKSIRMKLYRMQVDITTDFCKTHGIPVIPPPAGCMDNDGFLKREYWNNDATHGNTKYGALVKGQILEFLGS